MKRRWVWYALLVAVLLPSCSDDDASGNVNQNDNQVSLTCGNGTVEALEGCDDGEANSDTQPDACRTDCRLPHCGDGVVDDGEACDDGLANSDLVPDACRESCQPSACGDAVVDVLAGESCDDGNTTGGDGCNEQCVPEYCGNGFLEPDEICDDGNFEVGDGCSANCQSDESCGNGIVDFVTGETCDDGNAGSHDGCGSGCTAEVPKWIQWGHGWGSRREHAAAFYTTRGVMVVFGGVVDGGLAGDTWAFDTERWWRVVPWVSPPPRRGHAMVYDPIRDRLVLFGGEGVSGALNDTWEFDGWTWRQLSPPTSPPARLAHGMTYDQHRRRVVLYGGIDSAGGSRLDDTWELQGETWTQITATPSPPARDGPSLVYDKARRVTVLFGGETDGGLVDDTWELDGTGWVERVGLPAIPPARRSAAADFWVLHISGTFYVPGVVVHGGLDANGGTLDDLWAFDGTQWYERVINGRPGSRYGHTLTYSPKTYSLTLVGGEQTTSSAGDNGSVASGEAETWTLEALESWPHVSWTQSDIYFLPEPRDGAAMAWDPDRRRMVLYGGTIFWYGAQQDTWEFDGLQWYPAQPASSAGARARAGMAYHRTRGEMVIFGGHNASGVNLATTATYDGDTWTVLPAGTDPPARTRTAMAYDAVQDKVVLFGGAGNAGALDDTWEWDGTWSHVTTTHAPSPREAHQMVWDEDRQRVVLFGGFAGGGYADDTWEYDGADWVEVVTSQAPGSRANHSMAYHALRKRTVVFGGATPVFEQDTWELDPDNDLWWAVGTAEVPSRRKTAAMAFNPELRAVMLFGGNSGAWLNPFLGDTWFYGYTSVVPEEQCANGADDDTDQLVDCADPDCEGRPCGTAGGRCEAGACVCAGGTTETTCDDWLDNDCDGLPDCADPDCAAESHCEATEQSCLDSIDNDGDGWWDCGDPDCYADPACDQATCSDWIPLYCDTAEISTTVGAPANIDAYACGGGVSLPGPESAYRFVAPADGLYTASLVQLSTTLRLVVIGTDASGGCDPQGACTVVAAPGSDQLVQFNAQAGQVFFLLADSATAAVDPFVLGILCPQP